MLLRSLITSTLLVGSLYANCGEDIANCPHEESNNKTKVITEKASSQLDERVFNFQKTRIMQNRGIKLLGLDLKLKKTFPNKWTGYMYNISYEAQGKRKFARDVLFTNGTDIANGLQTLDGEEYSRMMHPDLTEEYYDKKFLLVGNENAKHKLVIFSEPLCPACVNVLPAYIEQVKTANPDELALYYIPMPLRMHYLADDLVKASILAKKDGHKDVSYRLYKETSKIYKSRPLNPFDPYKEENIQVGLDLFNKAIGTNYKPEDIDKKFLNDEVESYLKLSDRAIVDGTPTIFFDGQVDSNRNKHLKFIKK